MTTTKPLDLLTLIAQGGGVCTVAEAGRAGVPRMDLTRAERDATIVRLARGVYARCDPERPRHETFRLTVIGVLRRRRHPHKDAASHACALALHGVATYATPLYRYDVTSHTPTARRHGQLWVHPWVLGFAREEVDGIGVVPVALACVQVAGRDGFEAGVVAMDSALHQQKVTKAELRRAVDLCAFDEGANTARAAVQFADGRAESAGESRARMIFDRNGFRVALQQWFEDLDGVVGRVDMLIDGKVVIEFDGAVKYTGEDWLTVRMAEKRREDRLRALGLRIVRITWSELDRPEVLVARVRAELRLAA